MPVFKSDRNKNSIFKGIRESLASKIPFFYKRSIDKNADQVTLTTDEEKLRKLVEDLLAQKAYDQFVETLKYSLNYY